MLPQVIAEPIARAAGWLSRRLGRGGGTTLPGVVLLRLRPNAIAEMAERLDKGVVLISATNGKTTTTRLVVAAAAAVGHRVVTNAEGSNLARGVAAALLAAPAHSDLGIFEVDEAALQAVVDATEPRVVVLMNLFRDQLDRYGELDTLVDRWQGIVQAPATRSATLVINADDPNLAAIGSDESDVLWFGVQDQTQARDGLAHAADATTCRRCGTALIHDSVFVGHLGHWRCPTGDVERPAPTVAADSIRLTQTGQSLNIITGSTAATGPSGDVSLDSPLAGLHNSYNLVAAAATAVAMDLDLGAVGPAIAATKPAFGRGEQIVVQDRALNLLLAKNPTGVNQNIATVLAAPLDGVRATETNALILLNDRIADGQDISWIWDVDWEPLADRFDTLTVGGTRAWDMALRFRYGGFDMSQVNVQEDLATALDTAVAAAAAGSTVHALATYTAMLDLRAELTNRGLTRAYWDEP